MCVNYFPAADGLVYEQLGLTFDGTYEADSWPAKNAPIIVVSPKTGKPTVITALYGLLPRFAKDLTFCRNTYNARSESVATKPSFRDAWAKGRFCLVPMYRLDRDAWTSSKCLTKA
jgi:putative SOS response-associated peptidase YedK